ncbi:MAG: hypothetical protein CFE45_44075, partial [Burkholderiales bacterium PBB5]
LPKAINSAGQVLGSVIVGGGTHAALYSQGRTLDLGTLGGSASRGTGLNANGTVVGWAARANGTTAGFVVDGLGMRATRASAGFDAFLPTGLNDLGQVLGTGRVYSSGRQVMQLAASPETVPVDINAYLAAGTATTLVDANFITASGQIAGSCNGRACLLTPTGTLAWGSTTGGSFDDARYWDSGLGFAPNRHLDVLVAPAAAVTVRASQGAEMKSLVVGTTTMGASQATLQLAQGAR